MERKMFRTHPLAVIISVSRERLIYSLILALNSHNIQKGIVGGEEGFLLSLTFVASILLP